MGTHSGPPMQRLSDEQNQPAWGHVPAVLDPAATVGKLSTESFRRSITRERLAPGRPTHADMVLANPSRPAAVGPTVQSPAAAIPDIAAVSTGRPVVAVEGDAALVALAYPSSPAHLPHEAATPAIERAATAVPDLSAVVEKAIGIVTSDRDA